MSFFRPGSKRYIRIASWLILVILPACQPEAVRQDKALRSRVVHELRNHSYAAAAPLAREMVQRAPKNERAWKYLLQAQIGLHDLDGARQSLTDWRKAIPSPSPRTDEFEGDIAREEHDFAGSLLAWQKVVQAQPKNRRVHEKIALLQQNQQHWNDANSAWSEALQLKDNATARINRAICHRRLHQWPEAFEDVRHALELGPDDPDVRQWSKLFDALGKSLDQIGAFDAKLQILPEDIGLLSDRSLLFLRCGDPEMALEDAERAAKLAPWAMRPTLFRGIALIELNRGRECEALSIRQPLRLEFLTPEFLENMSRLDSAISVERNNPEHYIARSWQLNEIAQAKLALQDAETAVRLDSKSAAGLTELSYALTKLGRGPEALERIKQATDLESNSAPAWQYRGELEMVAGNYLAAVDSLSRALGIHQTIAAFQKREECYHRLGLDTRAEEDHRAIEKLMATSAH